MRKYSVTKIAPGLKYRISFILWISLIAHDAYSQGLMPGDSIDLSFTKYIGSYPSNMRRAITYRQRTDTILQNIPESLESYMVYKIDLARAHTNYLNHLSRDTSLSFIETDAPNFSDTTLLTSQTYNHFVYAVCGLRSGQKVIIFDTDHNRDLKGEKVYQFPYNRAGLYALKRAPKIFKVDPLTRMDRTPGNELMLNYEMYNGDTIIPCSLLVEVQANYAMAANPTVPEDTKWFDYHFVLLTIEHARAQVEIMDSLYEVSLIPSSMAKYLSSHKFIKNLSNPDAPMLKNYAGGPLIIGGREVSIRTTPDATTGVLKVSEHLATSRQPLQISDYSHDLLDVLTEVTVGDSSLLGGDRNLLHFFGTWCGPCKRDFPKLLELSLSNPDLHLVGCASEWKVNFEQLRNLKNSYELDWNVLVDKYRLHHEKNLANQWGISFYPTYILADRKGNVLINTKDLEQIKQFIDDDK